MYSYFLPISHKDVNCKFINLEQFTEIPMKARNKTPMLNETAIPWPKNRFRLAQGGKLYTITWPNSGIEVQSFFWHFGGRVLPKNEMAKKLRIFFFIFSTIFSIPASQYSPWVYRETIYALKLKLLILISI